MVSLIPQQQVLVDGAVILTFVSEAPNSPGMVILEGRAIGGPIVVARSRITPVA